MIPISYGKLDSKTYYSNPSLTKIIFYLTCLENQRVILAHRYNINIIMPTFGVGEKIKCKNTYIYEHVERPPTITIICAMRPQISILYTCTLSVV